MALDLGDRDRTAEIAPDGGSGTDKGMSRNLERFEVRLTTTEEEELIPRCN